VTAAEQCVPFPDGKLCANPDCTWGGTYDTHWCRDVSDMVRPGLPQKWQDLTRWKLEPGTRKTVDDLRASWENLECRGITGPLGSAGWHHVLAHFRYSRASDSAEHIP